MLFHSPVFIFLFLPLVWLVYRAFLASGKWAAALNRLLLASLVFYGWEQPAYLALFIASLGFNFWVGGQLIRGGARLRRVWLALGVGGNLSAILFFKYAGFFRMNLAWFWGELPTWETWALPLGISFYTFQQIAFLWDGYRGKIARIGFRDFALYISFFPQLIAGPIVLHSELVPQFTLLSRRDTFTDLLRGGTFLLVGLVKKVILADSLIGHVTPVFDASPIQAVPFFSAVGGVLAYGLELYFDFSGYSDMAVGLGLLFGFEIPENFAAPYRARNIQDFWRRWHITLSRFIRDYLYRPLGGSHEGTARTVFHLLLVMTLVGLWHGAGWNFVAWGGLHGFLLVAYHLWPRRWRLPKVGSWALTQGAVFLAWILFRSSDFTRAASVFRSLAEGKPATEMIFWLERFWADPAALAPMLWLLALAALAVVGPTTAQWIRGEASVRWSWRPTMPFAAFSGFLFFIYLKTLFEARSSEFLYFNF